VARPPIPSTITELTPAWLTEALRAAGHLKDAAVEAVQVEPIGQGVGILCQLARLTLTYDRPVPAAPASLVAKLPTADPQTRGMVALFRFYEREVRFYAEVAPLLAVRTPRCYFHDFDPARGDFILLLEDLSACRLGDQLAGASADELRLAVAELAKLHAAWWNSPRLEAFPWVPVANDPVNKAGLALYPQAWPAFLERFGHALPEAMRRTGERLGACVGAILDRFTVAPRTICHGDYRLDNLFFGGPAAPLAVIDWQIAVRSVGTYDVGYLMSQSVHPDVRRREEMSILRAYHQMLVERGVQGYSFDDCLTDYRWTLLFCFCYPVMGGGLGDLSNERGYALAKTMMERSAAAIMDWEAWKLLDTLEQ
jgi:aminoglycoside/choline kinase family phosphotransferase